MFDFQKIIFISCNILLLCFISRLAEAAAVDSADKVTEYSDHECFGEVGCLNNEKQYTSNGLLDLVYSYKLYTRKNLNKSQKIKVNSVESVKKTNFDSTKPTKFIIHGFMDNCDVKWMKEMKDELLKNSDWNVILVGWISMPPYLSATFRTRPVGKEIANFINRLQDLVDLNVEKVHLIGHSLGAHIAGFVGKQVKGIGRITGLDPAGPNFKWNFPSYRLYHTDAQFVDVIHTGVTKFGLAYGMELACGHIDFYPNGGEHQPGCIGPNSVIDAARYMAACNHMRAVYLFTESINSECPFVANQCDSYKKFKKGKCFSNNTTDISVMGLKTTKPNHPEGLKYYLSTGGHKPYCRQQYKVNLDLVKPLGYFQHFNVLPSNSLLDSESSDDDELMEDEDSSSFVVVYPLDKEKEQVSYWKSFGIDNIEDF